MLFRTYILFLFCLIVNFHVFADVKVKGYYRENGTYVQPHYRSNPDGNFNNNWSTVGNVNPYTGEYGTKTVNPNHGRVYKPSTIKDLIVPYTTSYSSNNSQSSNKQYNFTNSTYLDNIESELKIRTSQRLKNLGYTGDTSNLSHMDMMDLESRILASQRLKNLGYIGDISNLSHMEMIELESRIRSSQRLKSLGYSGDTSNLSNMEMIELESRIRSSQRLKNLGY